MGRLKKLQLDLKKLFLSFSFGDAGNLKNKNEFIKLPKNFIF